MIERPVMEQFYYILETFQILWPYQQSIKYFALYEEKINCAYQPRALSASRNNFSGTGCIQSLCIVPTVTKWYFSLCTYLSINLVNKTYLRSRMARTTPKLPTTVKRMMIVKMINLLLSISGSLWLSRVWSESKVGMFSTAGAKVVLKLWSRGIY